VRTMVAPEGRRVTGAPAGWIRHHQLAERSDLSTLGILTLHRLVVESSDSRGGGVVGGHAAAMGASSDEVVADDSRPARRRWLRRAFVAVLIVIAAAMWATRGLSPWEMEARVAGVVRSHPGTSAHELERMIAEEFADSDATYRGSDGTPFSPVSDSGVAGEPVVHVSGEGTVRVALLYAEAPVIPTGWGDMYCVVVDVEVAGGTRRTRVQPDFTRPDACAHALR
jgi:hypothetical protein